MLQAAPDLGYRPDTRARLAHGLATAWVEGVRNQREPQAASRPMSPMAPMSVAVQIGLLTGTLSMMGPEVCVSVESAT